MNVRCTARRSLQSRVHATAGLPLNSRDALFALRSRSRAAPSTRRRCPGGGAGGAGRRRCCRTGSRCWRRWRPCCCSWRPSSAAFWYLRAEEMEREQEAVKRDVEYAQQRVRLRLLERQEQLMRLARDASNREIDADRVREPRRIAGEPVSRAAGDQLDRRPAPLQGRLRGAQRRIRRSSARPARCCVRAKSRATTRWRASCASPCSRSRWPAAIRTGAAAAAHSACSTRACSPAWCWASSRSTGCCATACRRRSLRAMRCRCSTPRAA